MGPWNLGFEKIICSQNLSACLHECASSSVFYAISTDPPHTQICNLIFTVFAFELRICIIQLGEKLAESDPKLPKARNLRSSLRIPPQIHQTSEVLPFLPIILLSSQVNLLLPFDTCRYAFPQPFLKSVKQVLCSIFKSVRSSFIPQVAKKQTSSSKAKSSNYSLFQNFVFQKNVYVAKRLDSIPVLQMPACTIGDSIASTSTSSMRCNSCMHQKTKRLAATFKLMWMIFVVLSTYIDSQSSCSLRN